MLAKLGKPQPLCRATHVDLAAVPLALQMVV
jgi:hypothetical protein